MDTTARKLRFKNQYSQLKIIGANIFAGQDKKGVEKTPEILKNHRNFVDRVKNYGLDVADFVIIPEEIHDLHAQCTYLKDSIQSGFDKDSLTLVIGGDHSLSHGTVPGVVKGLDPSKPIKLVWVDAHADIDDMTSYYKWRHSMPVNAILGLTPEDDPFYGFKCLTPPDIVYVGVRELDDFDRNLFAKHNIKRFHMDTIREKGVEQVMKEVLEFLGDAQVIVSYDIDAMDATLCPGTGFPEPNGMDKEQAKVVIDELCKTNIRSLEVVEINDDLEKEGESTLELGEFIIYRFLDNLLKE